MYYKKKPVIIEAIRWDGNNNDEIRNFAKEKVEFISYYGRPSLLIDTLEGKMRAEVNDFIIKGIKGEFYPCKPDVFAQTYEAIDLQEY